MSRSGPIDRIEVRIFSFDVDNLSIGDYPGEGVGNVVHEAGAQLTTTRVAVRVSAADGARGEYVTHWVGTPATVAQTTMLAPHLLGRDPEHRELIWSDLKREARAYDHMGHGPLDIALWDLAGKRHDVSVARMLGAHRDRLATYASTYRGQDQPGGLDSTDAFCDFASECRELGFAGFKIHGWPDGDPRREATNVLAVRDRVGDDFALMLDPACQLRTFMDALYVGRACDEAGCFWYEDPYRDGGAAGVAHRRLREQLATPLLLGEYVRGLESKAGLVLGGGCDLLHADPEYDMGITGAMKIAHFCEALGLDVQLHACGPAHRAVMAALRNTHFYELALIGPDMPNVVPPVYACGYSDQPDAVGPDGSVPVPDGPGLGVTYDWDFIERHCKDEHVFE